MSLTLATKLLYLGVLHWSNLITVRSGTGSLPIRYGFPSEKSSSLIEILIKIHLSSDGPTDRLSIDGNGLATQRVPLFIWRYRLTSSLIYRLYTQICRSTLKRIVAGFV